MLFRQPETVLDDLPELPGWLDDMIGSEYRDDCLRIASGDHRGAKPDSVQGVARRWLAEEPVEGESRHGGGDGRGVLRSCADIPLLDRDKAFQAFEGKLQQALAANEWNQLLGQRATAHRPQARPGTTGDDQGVSH